MKQLNIRHFNANDENLTVTLIFLPKIDEDVRRLPNISKKKSENFRLHFCHNIDMGKKYVWQFADSNFFRERNACNLL